MPLTVPTAGILKLNSIDFRIPPTIEVSTTMKVATDLRGNPVALDSSSGTYGAYCNPTSSGSPPSSGLPIPPEGVPSSSFKYRVRIANSQDQGWIELDLAAQLRQWADSMARITLETNLTLPRFSGQQFYIDPESFSLRRLDQLGRYWLYDMVLIQF